MVKFMIEVEFEGIEREWWELKNRVLGLRELNGVKEVKIVEGE